MSRTFETSLHDAGSDAGKDAAMRDNDAAVDRVLVMASELIAEKSPDCGFFVVIVRDTGEGSMLNYSTNLLPQGLRDVGEAFRSGFRAGEEDDREFPDPVNNTIQ
jgi:hypothetical protein